MTDVQILPTNTVKNVWGLGKENLCVDIRTLKTKYRLKVALVIVKRYDFMVLHHVAVNVDGARV